MSDTLSELTPRQAAALPPTKPRHRPSYGTPRATGTGHISSISEMGSHPPPSPLPLAAVTALQSDTQVPPLQSSGSLVEMNAASARAKHKKIRALRKIFHQFEVDEEGRIRGSDLLKVIQAKLSDKPYEIQNTKKKLPNLPGIGRAARSGSGTGPNSPGVRRRRTTSPAENISIAIQQRFQDPEFSCSLWHGLGYKDDDYAEARIDFETFVGFLYEVYDENGEVNVAPTVFRAEAQALISVLNAMDAEFDAMQQERDQLQFLLDTKHGQFRADMEQLEQAGSAQLGLVEAALEKVRSEKQALVHENTQLKGALANAEHELTLQRQDTAASTEPQLRRQNVEIKEQFSSLKDEYTQLVTHTEEAQKNADNQIYEMTRELRDQSQFIDALQTELQVVQSNASKYLEDAQKYADMYDILHEQMLNDHDNGDDYSRLESRRSSRAPSLSNLVPLGTELAHATGELRSSRGGTPDGKRTASDAVAAIAVTEQGDLIMKLRNALEIDTPSLLVQDMPDVSCLVFCMWHSHITSHVPCRCETHLDVAEIELTCRSQMFRDRCTLWYPRSDIPEVHTRSTQRILLRSVPIVQLSHNVFGTYAIT
eukprot:m.36642 g.36642  ORF g.36642 m.36642 type:complete len:596 (-) comp14518_c0_seq5:154-1941(-)